MKLLLDTCSALFLWEGNERLSATAAAALRDPQNEVFLHQVSYLEITLKHALRKLHLTEPPSQLIPKALKAYDIRFVRLSNADILGLESLPFHHRDPFDRLLISHAMGNGLVLVTPDAHAAHYGVPLLW